MKLHKLVKTCKIILHQYLQLVWYKTTLWRYLLLPLSGLYRVIISLRRFAYHFSHAKSTQLNIPVIVVGNLTVGGTGKTPLIIWLAQYLRALGYKPGIISRGYGGHAKQYPAFVGTTSPAACVGDEAILLARYSGCPIIVDPQRLRAAKTMLVDTSCNIILSDDGLQHLKLPSNITIATVGTRGFGNGSCLPAGPLREPIKFLQNVDFILWQQPQTQAIKLSTTTAIQFSFSLAPKKFINVKNSLLQEPLDYVANKTLHAITGIGNHERFFNSLRELGATIIEHPFPDHYLFTADDFTQFKQTDIVVMTEKDAVKCTDFAQTNFWYLNIQTQIDEAFKIALQNKLLSLIK